MGKKTSKLKLLNAFKRMEEELKEIAIEVEKVSSYVSRLRHRAFLRAAKKSLSKAKGTVEKRSAESESEEG